MREVKISCTTTKLVHWIAKVQNETRDCSAVVTWKAYLQIKVNNVWSTALLQTGATYIPAHSTVYIEGDFCYIPAANVQKERVLFQLDPSADTVDADNLSKKSSEKDPCRRTVACPVSPQATFSDVKADNAFYNEITNLSTVGIVSGYGDGTFRPYDKVTRGQLAKVVALAFGLNVQGATNNSQHFGDVSSDNPFYGYIEAAYSRGWLNGYADGTYRPYENVTRGQMAKVIVLAAGLKPVNPDKASFSDVEIGTTYYTYIETANANGLMAGYVDGTFQSEAGATRGQLAKVVFGGMATGANLLADNPDPDLLSSDK